MGNLEELKEGDKVICYNSFGNFIDVVEKVTKTQIHTKYGKYRRKDGYSVGACSFNVSYISELTPEKEDEIKEKCRIDKMRSFVRNFNFDKLSLDKLEKIYNILIYNEL